MDGLERDVFCEVVDVLAEMIDIVKYKRDEARVRGASAAVLAAYDDPLLHARVALKVARVMLGIRGDERIRESLETTVRRGLTRSVDSSRFVDRDAAGDTGAGELAGAGRQTRAVNDGDLH